MKKFKIDGSVKFIFTKEIAAATEAEAQDKFERWAEKKLKIATSAGVDVCDIELDVNDIIDPTSATEEEDPKEEAFGLDVPGFNLDDFDSDVDEDEDEDEEEE
jgi:hypothetical protein